MKLVVKNLKKNFEKKEVLKDINFEFEKGKIYGLLGRNGAGKTTFFNCLNEDLPIDSGNFFLEDKEIKKISAEDIGYVLSTPNVPEFLTAREFLKFFIEINKDRIKNEKSIDEYFEFMKIEKEDRDKLLKDYSHGMKNKMQMTKDHIIMFSTHSMELALDLCDEIVILNKGVLEKIDKNNLDNDKFKDKIIEALKEE